MTASTPYSQRLTALRQWMSQHHHDAFILPVADEFLSEYVPAHAMRLDWLTGFSGSAGLVAITQDHAALFTDGRYTIQAEQQLDTAYYEIHNTADLTAAKWLQQQQLAAIAYDPMLHSTATIEKYLAGGLALIPTTDNPIDQLWADRPIPTAQSAWIYPDSYAGQTASQKRTHIIAALTEHKADAALIATPESINWLLNIRGHDVQFTPIVQAYALVQKTGSVLLFADEAKFDASMTSQLADVTLCPIANIAEQFTCCHNQTVMAEKSGTPYGLWQALQQAGATVLDVADPCILPKAIKNAVEIGHMREVHHKDGAALTETLYWLYHHAVDAGATEMDVDAKLLERRSGQNDFISPSFATIAGSGPHGAIVHYKADETSNRMLSTDELLLIDSGGQYLGGTTDVTRTITLGSGVDAQRQHFTHVLKGHIALARAVFPQGTTGSQLDVLARHHLWQAGLDYDHGTGHGVGACLSVHEGPQRISKRSDSQALKPGMILSNEPGYYEAGSHGIRIESLVVVVEKMIQNGQLFLGFDTLTAAPIDRRLIDKTMLNEAETAWINDYHAWVFEQLQERISATHGIWLKEVCQPL